MPFSSLLLDGVRLHHPGKQVSLWAMEEQTLVSLSSDLWRRNEK
jgi:hypothetical protein